MNQKTLLAANTAASYSYQAIRTVLAVAMVPFVINRVGKEPYGLYQTVLSISSLLALLSLGVPSALTRFIARGEALGDRRGNQETWMTAIAAYLIPTFLVLSVFIPAAPWIAAALHLAPDQQVKAVHLLRIGGAMFAANFIVNAYRGVLRGLQRQFEISAVEISAELTRNLLIILVLVFWTSDVFWVLVVVAVTDVVSNVSLAVIVHIRCDWARFDRTAIRWERLREILSFSVLNFVARIDYILTSQVHRVIIGALLGPAVVSAYFIAGYPRDLLDMIIMQFATAMVPVAAKYHAVDNAAVLRALLLRGSRYSVLMAGLIAAPLAAFAEPMLRTWVPKYPDFAVLAPLLGLLLLIAVVELTRGASYAVLVGMGRVKLLAAVNAGALVVDAALAYLLLKHTSLGLYALAVSTAIVVVVRRVIITWYVCELVDVSRRRFLIDGVLKALLPGLVSYAAGRALLAFGIDAVGWFRLLPWGALCGLTGVAAALLFTLRPEERAELLGPAQAVWRKLRPAPSPDSKA